MFGGLLSRLRSKSSNVPKHSSFAQRAKLLMRSENGGLQRQSTPEHLGMCVCVCGSAFMLISLYMAVACV